MGYRSEKQRPQSATGRLEAWRRAIALCGVALSLTTVTTPLGAAVPRKPATVVPGGTAPEGKTAPASKAALEGKGDDKMPRARQRGGSSSREQRVERTGVRAKPGLGGEVEGGTGRGTAGGITTGGAVRREVKGAAAAAVSVKPPCVREAVQFERGFGGDAQTVVLTRCDGRPNSAAVEQLSILVRPMNVARPSALASRIRRAAHREWLPGVKRIHEGLVTRLQGVVDRFQARKITLISGYRPTSLGSFHQSARALDVHVEGVPNDKLVDFCRTLPDTGCGYYPNSSFVHLDVRPSGTGHVYWIDASGPGEPARYVSSWPINDSSSATSGIAPPDPAAPLDEQTHPGAPRPPLGGTDSKIDARTTAPWWGGESRENAFSP